MKNDDSNHRIYKMSFASVYPHYLNKAKKKGRTQAEVDEIVRWLTGYTPAALKKQIDTASTFEDFFGDAPKMNPKTSLISGVVCGVRVEEIKHPLMRKIRYLDKLIDELAAGKSMEKIFREDDTVTAKKAASKKKTAPKKKAAPKKTKKKT